GDHARRDLRLQNPGDHARPHGQRAAGDDRGAAELPLQVRQARSQPAERALHEGEGVGARVAADDGGTMKRRFVTAAILCLVALVAVLPSSAASRGPRITEAGGSVFPGRAYIVSLPHGRQLAPGAITIYDAVTASLDLLRSAQIKAGTIILLSDGQEARAHANDTSAHQTEATAAAAARAAHVRIFTVGLRSRFAKLGTLRQLAGDTGGR